MIYFKQFYPIRFKKYSKPLDVKLVIGLLTGKTEYFTVIRSMLEKTYGPCDLVSPIFDFHHTNYYEEEFGSDLKKMFFSFRDLKTLTNIYKIKLFTNRIENNFKTCSKRQVNIDPGFISHSKLALFTTKDYSHRIYLHDGIFAEVTLKYEQNSFAPWPWTYPDYKTKEYIEFFNKVRMLYCENMQSTPIKDKIQSCC